uniref:C-type lectin domain-containing protein n=1 Tax=Astatotilapia calliptera TaxID=8154 RepID=A0A3P8P7T8_ASTCA
MSLTQDRCQLSALEKTNEKAWRPLLIFSKCPSFSKWHDAYPGNTRPFFCYRAIVVKQEKTWEEALEYCRKHHEDLASVASETEMLLIQKELSKHNTKEVVWIGLRFLSEDWLWVDREMMDYEAWSQGGKPLCPSTKTKCGALQVTRGTKGVWEAHNCEEKLQFICY